MYKAGCTRIRVRIQMSGPWFDNFVNKVGLDNSTNKIENLHVRGKRPFSECGGIGDQRIKGKPRKRRCFLLDSFFLARDGQPIAVAKLTIGDFVLGVDDKPVQVTWKQVHPESTCNIVDLKTNSTKVSVTDSHRIPQELDDVMDASIFHKGEELLVKKGSGPVVNATLQSVTTAGEGGRWGGVETGRSGTFQSTE